MSLIFLIISFICSLSSIVVGILMVIKDIKKKNILNIIVDIILILFGIALTILVFEYTLKYKFGIIL